MISHQREAPGGKLYPDLMGPAGMKPDPYKASVSFGKTGKFQTGTFHPSPHPPYDEYLVFHAVLPQKILPVALLRGNAVYQGNVFLHHIACLNCPAQLRRRGLGSGEDHETAYVLIQAMNGKKLPAQGGLQGVGKLLLGIKPHRLDTHHQIGIRKENIHEGTPLQQRGKEPQNILPQPQDSTSAGAVLLCDFLALGEQSFKVRRHLTHGVAKREKHIVFKMVIQTPVV